MSFHRTTTDVVCFIFKIAISRAAIALVISPRCFPLTPEWRQTIIQNDFLIRLAKIKLMSRYAHTSCWPHLLRWSFLSSPLVHFSLSLFLYLSRCIACINMRRCTRLVQLHMPYIWVLQYTKPACAAGAEWILDLVCITRTSLQCFSNFFFYEGSLFYFIYYFYLFLTIEYLEILINMYKFILSN